MGNGNAFLDDLKAINAEARARFPETNIARSTRGFIDQGGNGSRLGLGTREERSAKRREVLDVNGRPFDKLTSTSRMFRDSLSFRR